MRGLGSMKSSWFGASAHWVWGDCPLTVSWLFHDRGVGVVVLLVGGW